MSDNDDRVRAARASGRGSDGAFFDAPMLTDDQLVAEVMRQETGGEGREEGTTKIDGATPVTLDGTPVIWDEERPATPEENAAWADFLTRGICGSSGPRSR